MITKEEWDEIAKCMATHPDTINNEEANKLLKKLAVLARGDIKELTCVNSYGKVTKKVVIEYEEDI